MIFNSPSCCIEKPPVQGKIELETRFALQTHSYTHTNSLVAFHLAFIFTETINKFYRSTMFQNFCSQIQSDWFADPHSHINPIFSLANKVLIIRHIYNIDAISKCKNTQISKTTMLVFCFLVCSIKTHK